MLRPLIFLPGFAMIVVGAASNIEIIPEIMDCRSITCNIGNALFSLDVIFIMGGVALAIIAWLMGKLGR